MALMIGAMMIQGIAPGRCAIGIYSVDNSSVDILVTSLFGLPGFICAKLECEPAR